MPAMVLPGTMIEAVMLPYPSKSISSVYPWDLGTGLCPTQNSLPLLGSVVGVEHGG